MEPVDGILNVAKPAGWTSHDVVARVRRLTGERRAGHAGTLDPIATGVLPVALGHATRLIEYLADARKTYRAGVRLGMTTTTLDASGEVVEARPVPPLTQAQIEASLVSFRGRIEQIPPMYSAVKVGGRRLYDLARQGESVERSPRTVEIFRLDLEAYQAPDLVLDVECSKGTYIRTLADDLGRALGCGAHLTWLVRTRVGPFHLAQSVDLDRIAQTAAEKDWEDLLWAADEILIEWPALVVGEATARSLSQGRSIPVGPIGGDRAGVSQHEWARAYSAQGEFLAVVEWDRQQAAWRPRKVLVGPH